MTLRIRSFFGIIPCIPSPLFPMKSQIGLEKGLPFKHLRCCIRIAPLKQKRETYAIYIYPYTYLIVQPYFCSCIYPFVFDQSTSNTSLKKQHQLLPPQLVALKKKTKIKAANQRPPRCLYWTQVFDSNQCRWKHWNFLRHDKGEVHPPLSWTVAGSWRFQWWTNRGDEGTLGGCDHIINGVNSWFP